MFLADIAAETLMNDIPDELIFNWDQTGLHMVPTGEWTMHKNGDKVVPIAHSDDKTTNYCSTCSYTKRLHATTIYTVVILTIFLYK